MATALPRILCKAKAKLGGGEVHVLRRINQNLPAIGVPQHPGPRPQANNSHDPKMPQKGLSFGDGVLPSDLDSELRQREAVVACVVGANNRAKSRVLRFILTPFNPVL